ncbi:Mg2+ and Co2+ transporter CorB [Acetivibrio mesophilus]|uniref:Mg2+ and Co2+ transporter CorB n=1 Tax=Acetivibrio mesophilus TaxID=2487273 RepID=A0A4Q0I5Z5_9FIRM|nr:Mg2+ and Co2+ transporter CorB [Acetivibrio mesophilus]ODM25312.1 Mg2+ and Co2+ transporter CorB [Clostridium sp. Bc-iso-3]RXE59668.1 Mg2+ and Co2+ transporter CorB [Acetivibrio mesophilus]HHV28612.1 Mg2+ and Co2+ transporter CorB [Clostridium sp.]
MDDNYRHPLNEKKMKFRSNVLGTKNGNTRWVVLITICAFLLSSSLSFVSSSLLEDVNIFFSILIVLIIVLIGIVFDIIGIAVTSADESPFHAMASRRYYGAKQAIRLIRNANKVSSVCNDVVGDICGVISGTASAFIVFKVARSASGIAVTLVELSFAGFVAALTIGGKAIGKTIAIENSNYIVYKVGVVAKFVMDRLGFGKKKKKKS